MEPAGSITYQNICFPCFSRLDSIVNNCSGVRSLLLPYELDTDPVCPYFKLIYGGCSEGIRCSQHDLFALFFQGICYFPNGCRLANTIYTDYHDHGRRRFYIEFLCFFSQYPYKGFFYQFLNFQRICYFSLFYLASCVINYTDSCIDTEVSCNKYFLQLLEQFLIHFPE